MGETVQLVLDALRPTRGEHWEQEKLPGTEERRLKSHISRLHEMNWFAVELLTYWDFEEVFVAGKVSEQTRDRFFGELMALSTSFGPIVEKMKRVGISVEPEGLSRRPQERFKKKGNCGLYGEKVTGRRGNWRALSLETR